MRILQYLATVVGLAVFNSIGAPLTPVTERHASLPPPASGGGHSELPILTPDGRYVVFASSANNLVTNGAGNAFASLGLSKMNVFRRDRIADITTLVSLNAAGTGGGLADSFPTAISDDGRHGELHRWQDPRTMPPLSPNGSLLVDQVPTPNNPDVAWLQDHASRPK